VYIHVYNSTLDAYCLLESGTITAKHYFVDGHEKATTSEYRPAYTNKELSRFGGTDTQMDLVQY